MKNITIYNSIIFVTYILVILIADATATQLIQLPFGLVTNFGTLIFGLVFTLRDELHTQGIKKVYSAIAVASILALIVNYITGSPIQIILASLVAFVIGESLDTQTFQNFKSSKWIHKSLFSNFFSIPVDSILFNTLAFWGTPFQPLILQFTISQIIFKYIVATILALIININKSKKTF